MFSEVEKRFLTREHAVEGLRELPFCDYSTFRVNREQSIRCYEELLEKRSKLLGKTFRDFQAKAAGLPTSAELDAQIEAAKMF
jgi:hypothetical protein